MHQQSDEEEIVAAIRRAPEAIQVQLMMTERRILATGLPMEVHAVIQYEWTHWISDSVFHDFLQIMGDEFISHQMVGCRYCMSNEGRRSAEDDG
ncbi:hypothetical protein TNCV_4881191 [Trichonephila clavipes]|nr:hypothetical protein TNCV_4881191 [Trichonephila clavipes]